MDGHLDIIVILLIYSITQKHQMKKMHIYQADQDVQQGQRVLA